MPRQFSTGDQTILGRIVKRGADVSDMLFVQAEKVSMMRPNRWPAFNFDASPTEATALTSQQGRRPIGKQIGLHCMERHTGRHSIAVSEKNRHFYARNLTASRHHGLLRWEQHGTENIRGRCSDHTVAG